MGKASSFVAAIAMLFMLVVLVVIGLAGLGVLDFQWPWENIDVATEETVVTFDEEEPEPKIIKIEPIALDCRARINAQVPVRASREHQLVGQTYRTDTVEMVAIGDVDTCVNTSAVEIAERTDGSIDVIVPADAIEFVRPRVDAVATMDSVVYDKGLVGKVTDVFPWVSDNDGLTPAAYAFAQSVVGGSDCMQQAYDLTESAMREAYVDQMIAQGGSADNIDVIVSGSPNFGQNELPADPAFDEFDFTIDGNAAVCEIAADAYAGTTIESADK